MTSAMIVRVIVAATKGSTPREVGAQMLVGLQGLVAGTIGGGALEFEAIAQARDLLQRGHIGDRLKQSMILGPDLAQCCGGVVDLTFTIEPQSSTQLTTQPIATLCVYGAGHVGRAVVRAIRDLPVSVVWIDDAATRFPTKLEGNALRHIATDLAGAADATPPGALHLVLTYAHQADEAICRSLLRRSDFLWLGLIGSETKAARFRQRFARDGIDPNMIARLRSPVGVLGVASKAPEFIAISIAAEIAQVLAEIGSRTGS